MATTIIADQQTQVSQLYVSLFGRAADNAGFGYWVSQLASGVSLQNIAQSFYNSTEARTLYSAAQTNQQFVIQFYSSVLGRTVTGTDAGVAYWTAQLNVAGKTQGSLIIDILTALSAPSTDPVVIASQNLLNARTTVSTAYALANGQVGGASAILSGVVDAATAATAVAAIGNGVIGSTFNVTTGLDTLVGTSGNDTFIADNSNTVTLTAADTINGGSGIDTLKVYLGATATAPILTGLTSIENVYINAGTGAFAGVDVSAVSGVTGLQIEAGTAAATYALGNGQSLSLTKTGGANITTVSTTAATTSLNLVTNGQAGTLAFASNGGTATTAGLATVNLTNTGAASTFTLTNAAGALATLNIFGDKAVTITEALSTLKTVNASTDTGGVTLNVTATVNAAFAFTGGTGNDKLSITEASLTALTAGTQLDGGVGTDTLAIGGNGTAAALVISAGDYTKINAVKNFEILSLTPDAGFGVTVDASQITTIKEFQFGTTTVGTDAITNISAGTTIDLIGNTAAVTVGAALGVTATTINVGSATAAAGITATSLTTTGLTSIALVSNGTGAGVNNVTLVNSDNSTITITGSAALTLALAAGTSTGSIVNGSAATGALTITGSNQGDTLTGGSAADTLTSGTKASTLTGGAGADKFIVTNTVYGAGGQIDTITDFTKGADSLTLAAQGTTAFTTAAVNVTAATSFTTALNIAVNALATGAVNGQIDWFQYGGNTYVVESVTAQHATVAATDLVVKLTGTIDLSTGIALTGAVLA